MIEREFSPLRSKASRKPWPECPEIIIYRCSQCGVMYQGLGFSVPNQEPVCCHMGMEQLKPLTLEQQSSDIHLDYKIIGGHNQNAVQVWWKTRHLEIKPEWILLKTFTGGYIKYVSEKKIPPVVFPLADEDAYVYCDEDPCLQCVFRCKRGFSIYAYFNTGILLEIPLDKMNANY